MREMPKLAWVLLAVCAVAGARADVPLLELTAATTTLPAPWTIKPKSGTPRIRIATVDGARAVCLDSRSASFSIQRPVTIDLRTTPVLEWSWSADALPANGDLRDPDRDDQVAQLFVAFANRTAISYVWDSNAPAGTTARTRIPFVVTIRVLAVQSGAAQLNRWIVHSRNVREDYRRLFGREAPSTVDAVRFQINSQYTRANARSCLRTARFRE